MALRGAFGEEIWKIWKILKFFLHDGNTFPDTHKKFYDEIPNSFSFTAENVYPIIVEKSQKYR